MKFILFLLKEKLKKYLQMSENHKKNATNKFEH
jgi:hypothetical protein